MSRPAWFFLRFWLLSVMAAALAWVAAPAFAQAPAKDSAVKAAFLYKFGSFVDWPPGTFSRADEPLVIGVLGDDAVGEELEQLAKGRSVEGRPVRVRLFKEAETPSGVHLLFIGTVRPTRLRELLATLSGPVLVVTQQEGALRAGSVINFMADGARVRFAVSLPSAEVRGLHLSARLLAVAQAVEGRPR